MDRNQLARLRLANQQLIKPSFRSPAKLVDYFGTMQAQQLAQAKWAIGSRLQNSHVSVIEEAFAKREICRTWLLRGIISFVTPQDLGWILDFSSKRMKPLYDMRREKIGLSAKEILNSQDLIFRRLKQEQRLTQAELFGLLNEAGLDATGERAFLFLVYAAMDKILIMGYGEGKDTDYLLYDDQLASTAVKDDEEVIQELALRYFSSRGPAELLDFAWWAGVRPEEARRAVEALAQQLSVIHLDNKQYFLSPMSQMPTGPSVHLLPAFDEYIVAYRNRDIVLDPRRAIDIEPKKNGIYLPSFEINAEIEGTWALEVNEEAIRIQNKPFRPLLEQEAEAIREAGLRYLQFMTKWQPGQERAETSN